MAFFTNFCVGDCGFKVGALEGQSFEYPAKPVSSTSAVSSLTWYDFKMIPILSFSSKVLNLFSK